MSFLEMLEGANQLSYKALGKVTINYFRTQKRYSGLFWKPYFSTCFMLLI